MTSVRLFANNLHQDSLAPVAVKLTIKYLFPGAKIELPSGNGNNNLAPHDGSFQVGIAIIFTGEIMGIVGQRFMGRKPLEPFFKIAPPSYSE